MDLLMAADETTPSRRAGVAAHVASWFGQAPRLARPVALTGDRPRLYIVGAPGSGPATA
jgi:hypothetical protein